MKKLYSILLLVSINLLCFGQSWVIPEEDKEDIGSKAKPSPFQSEPLPNVQPDNNTIFNKVEEEATFSKGNISQYISQYIKYTDQALDNGTQGTIIIRFVIEKDGSVSDVRVASKKLGDGLDEVGIEAVKKTDGMWKPAKINGVLVRMYFRLPIRFVLSKPEPTPSPE